MAEIKHFKVVASLPSPLEPDSIYYVRVGHGYDQYVTNSTGLVVAYRQNVYTTELTTYTLGLSGSLTISDTIPADTNSPSTSNGYTLFSQEVDTVDGEMVEFDVVIPFVQIATTGAVTIHAFVNGQHNTSIVDRITTGASSGNSMSLKGAFTATSSTAVILIKIGPANGSITLNARFNGTIEPCLLIKRYHSGSTGGAPSPGPSPGPLSTGGALGGRKTIAIAGDSVTGQNSAPSSRELMRDIGYMTWASILCDQRVCYNPQWNFGVGGDSSTDLLARIGTVTATAADYVVIAIGGNDVSQNVPYETTIANLEAIWDACASAGMFVIAVTIYARGSQTSYSAEWQRRASRINNYIQHQQHRRTSFEVLNPIPVFMDYSNSDGKSKAIMVADGIHPGTYGAWYLGRSLADLINTLEPPRPVVFTDPGDVYSTGNVNGNMLPNGMLLGTGGAVSGATGEVADNASVEVTGSVDCVASKVISHHGLPAQRLDIQGTPTTPALAYLIASASDWPEGVMAEGQCVVRIEDGVGLGGLQMILRVDTGTRIETAIIGEVSQLTNMDSMKLPDGTWEGVMRTPPLLIPAGSVDVRLIVGFGAYPGSPVSGALEVSQMSIKKHDWL